MRPMQHLTAALVALPLLIPVAHAADMKGADIKTLLSGATGTGTTSRGSSYVGQYNADGTMSGSVADGKHTDTGTWRIVGDEYCSTWSKWRNGSEACFTVEALGDDEYRFNEGGKGSTTLKITKR